jgi:hypothetical protein
MVTTTGRRVTAITSRNGYERAVGFINAVPPIEQVLEPVKTAEVRAAHLAALRQVNRKLVGLHADVGRLIVSRRVRPGASQWSPVWRDLQAQFPGSSGFPTANAN